MNRKIIRNYFFSDNEVNEAIVAMLKSKDMQVPQYVGNAGTTKWTKEPKGIRVEWSEEDDL